jgi:superkiller protein 3
MTTQRTAGEIEVSTSRRQVAAATRITLLFAAFIFVASCARLLLAHAPSSEEVNSRVLQLLDAGKQAEAEELIEKELQLLPREPRLLFLRACCARSRFQVADSLPLFEAVAKAAPKSSHGRCAALMVELDEGRDVERRFAELRPLVDENASDPMLRWMIAVQCRARGKSEEGVKHYKKLLQHWNPGPVLVHQTYGNLLDELGRFEEALVERRKAVELEPAAWSYQGLGNTLAALRRFHEANKAYAMSVELAPEGATYWRAWAWGLLKQGRLDDSIAKCERAIALDSTDYLVWTFWGNCLELQGKLQAAVAKYRRAIAISDAALEAKRRLAEVEKRLRGPEPAAAGAGQRWSPR